MADVAQAGPGNAGVVAPPPIVYALPLIAGLLINRWRPVALVPHNLAAPLGIGFLVLGLVGLPAIVAFRRAKTSPKPWKPTTALVTGGPYRFTRNPMYVGFTLLYAGITIWMNTAWPAFFLPFVLIVMQVGVITREEAYLTRLFGDEYRAYQQRVRRWI